MKRSPMPPSKKGLKRKKGLNWRSDKAEATDEARRDVRAEVIERDLGDPVERPCVFHRILAAFDLPGICDAFEHVEVHEVLTRARDGDILNPANCVALCHLAHAWVTAHPKGAEALGLMLPSWKNHPGDLDTASSRRDVWERAGGPLPSFVIPQWRSDDIAFWVGAWRDLQGLLDLTALPKDQP